MTLLQLLIPLLALANTRAFMPATVPSSNAMGKTREGSPSLVPLKVIDQDSEWYCPPPTPPKPTQAAVLQTPLSSVEDFGEFLAGTERNELVLIKFHASWCRSCAKFGRKLDQLAAEGHAGLKIGTVEYMEGRAICQALQIEALPTVHMYYRYSDGTMQKVQDFRCPPSQFHKVQDFCKYYRNRSSVSVEEQEFAEALDRGHAMMESSIKDTKKVGKLRSGWKRLVTGYRVRMATESS